MDAARRSPGAIGNLPTPERAAPLSPAIRAAPASDSLLLSRQLLLLLGQL